MKPIPKMKPTAKRPRDHGFGGGPAPKRARCLRPIARYFDPIDDCQTSSGHLTTPPPPDVKKQPRTLFVDGINQLVSEEILYELFINAGPVDSVVIHHNFNKSFAFVRFEHEESVLYSINLFRDVKLFGQKIRMQEAIDNKDSSTHRKPLSEIRPQPKLPTTRQAVSPSSAIADMNSTLVEQQATNKQSNTNQLSQDFLMQLEDNLSRLRQNASRVDHFAGNRPNLHTIQTDSGLWNPCFESGQNRPSRSPSETTPSAFTHNLQDFQMRNQFQGQNIFQQERQQTGINPFLQFGSLNQVSENNNQLFPAMSNQVRSLNQDRRYQDMFDNQQIARSQQEQQFMQYPGNPTEQQNAIWNQATANQGGSSNSFLSRPQSQRFPTPSPWIVNSFDPRIDWRWGNPSQTTNQESKFFQTHSFQNDYFGPQDRFQSTEDRRISYEPEPPQTLVRDQTMMSIDLARSDSWVQDSSNNRIVRIGGVKDRLGGRFKQSASRLREVSESVLNQTNAMRRNPDDAFFDNIPDSTNQGYLESLRAFSEYTRDQNQTRDYPGANQKKNRYNRKWKNNR